MLIGYLRVSTDDQNLDLQRRAMTAAGVERMFSDQVSGSARERPGLSAALAALSEGDCLVVWRLDRLGRSLPHLIEIVANLAARGVEFRSLSEAIDTTSAGGRLVFHIMGALAEFERALIAERTGAGLAAAKARGVQLGRRAVLSHRQIVHARMLVDGGEPVAKVAHSMGVGRSTLYRALQNDPSETAPVAR